MAAPTKAPARSDMCAFDQSPTLPGGWVVDSTALRAPVKKVSDAAYVTRGARVTRKGDETPMFILRDGSATRGIETFVVGACIAGGVVTLAEVLDLLGVPAEKLPATVKQLQELVKAARQ